MALFKQLLKLHQGNIPLEDFFTEIIAYFLGKNKEILFSWLRYSHILDLGDYLGIDITTQKTYKHPVRGDEKRPDIVIELADGDSQDIIFIESKVGSPEGYNQLSDYAEILHSLPGFRYQILVYITRDFDPKKEFVVFQNIPNSNVTFKQLRWHQFYQFLSAQKNSEFAQEIITFMQEYRMAQSNQFSSVDILALANFPSSLKLMEEVMWGKVIHEFEEILGEHKSLEFRKRRALQFIQWHGRYIMDSWTQDKLGCGVGFYMKTADPSGYPTVRIVLEVDPKSSKRKEIFEEMRKVCTQFGWQAYNLDSPNAWAGIAVEQSLRDFLATEDHIFTIEEFLLKSLDDLRNIKQQYPQLLCRSVPGSEMESDEDYQNA
ncbi:hypothetical protein C7293_20025 [filamentous cyanobacterium CCT1]|nr:hypothetical protein C7293_20025 [filamentous cyanobacterium CCT1]PSN76689.1 hypothetical protein C8B47_25975 [filamentous cyanobacterium CCP4]